jgi:hypothetical protein
LGRIKVHIATVIGQMSPHMEPVYGLRALRRGPTTRLEGATEGGEVIEE